MFTSLTIWRANKPKPFSTPDAQAEQDEAPKDTFARKPSDLPVVAEVKAKHLVPTPQSPKVGDMPERGDPLKDKPDLSTWDAELMKVEEPEDFCELSEDELELAKHLPDFCDMVHVNRSQIPKRLPGAVTSSHRIHIGQAVARVARKAADGATQAAQEAVLHCDLLSLANPAAMGGRVLQGAVKGIVEELHSLYQGDVPTNHDQTIEAARAHLETGIFTDAQKQLVGAMAIAGA